MKRITGCQQTFCRAALATLLLLLSHGLTTRHFARTATPQPGQQDERVLGLKTTDPAKPSASAQTNAGVARPELVLQTGHANFVTGLMTLVFSADGRLLVSSNVGSNQLRLWDAARGHELRALAADAVGAAGGVLSGVSAVALSDDNALRRAGTLYVLAVGVNEYENPQYNLKYAAADAQSVGEEVRRQQAPLARYGRVEVVTLLNGEATKGNILAALRRLSAAAGDAPPAAGAPAAPKALAQLKPAEPEDAVIIYFAGHGTAQGNRFYLIPHDLGYTSGRDALDAEGLRKMLSHSISDEELQAAVEGLDAGQLLLVIDACNSGQALEAEEKRRGPMNSKGLAQLAYEKGMFILTAAQSYQAALEASQLGHGLLTYALVEEGLKRGAADTGPRDGQIVSREWLDYATERVPKMQIEKMQAARGGGLDLSFREEERGLPFERRSGQQPRVFYRRELEKQPLVIAKPQAVTPAQ